MTVVVYWCMFRVHRGSELRLGCDEDQESPRDINAADDISVFLKITYVALQGLTENGSCPLHAGGSILKGGSAPRKAGCPTVPVCGGCGGCQEHIQQHAAI